MRKFFEHTATALIALVITSGPALSAPLPFAEGSFGFVPNAPVTSSNNNLNPGTEWTEYPNNAFVNIPSTGNLDIVAGDLVETERFVYAPGLGTAPANLDITVNGLTFHFHTVKMEVHEVGFISAGWEGFLEDGDGRFAEGTLALLSQSCDQTLPGKLMNCSNTTLVAEAPTPVREPGSLAILGAALLGLGLIGRKKLLN